METMSNDVILCSNVNERKSSIMLLRTFFSFLILGYTDIVTFRSGTIRSQTLITLFNFLLERCRVNDS